MTTRPGLDIIQLTNPGDADSAVREQLTRCWIEVTNAGGAAGFPFPPVSADQVSPAVDALAARLAPQHSRTLLARVDGALAGWVTLSRDPSPLIAHWGTVSHLQTQLTYRNRGIGSALMHRLRQVARDEMSLEQLHRGTRRVCRAGSRLGGWVPESALFTLTLLACRGSPVGAPSH